MICAVDIQPVPVIGRYKDNLRGRVISVDFSGDINSVSSHLLKFNIEQIDGITIVFQVFQKRIRIIKVDDFVLFPDRRKK